MSILQLKAVHDKTHPARLPGAIKGRGGARGDAVNIDPAGAAEALLEAIAADTDDDRDDIDDDGAVAADAPAARR